MTDRVRPTLLRTVIAIAALTLVGAACDGGSPEPTFPPTATGATPIERPSTDATLEILAPTNGEVIDGGEVMVELRLRGGTISDDPATTELRPDEGHLHVSVDGIVVDMTADLTFPIEDLSPGQHLLDVEFVANDHYFFDPRVITKVAFETTA